MKISRRDFLKWAAASAAIFGLGKWESERIQYALASIEFQFNQKIIPHEVP